jgi:excisionase family DNA binding protein
MGFNQMIQDLLQNEELISLVEAAEYSGLTHDFLRELARKGKLPARKIGRDWVTTRTAIDEYLQGRSPVGRKPKSQKDA